MGGGGEGGEFVGSDFGLSEEGWRVGVGRGRDAGLAVRGCL